MKSIHVRCAAGLLAVTALTSPAANAQTTSEMESLLGSGPMQAAPPRPGDANLSCAQIAREMHTIMRARKVQLDANGMPGVNCDTARATTTTMGAPTGAMLSQLGGAMRAMNDPRLLRLTLLAQEKSCAAQEPDPTPTDACDSAPDASNRATQPDPFTSAKPSRGKTLSPAPSQSTKTKPANSKSAAPADPPPSTGTDPFRPR